MLTDIEIAQGVKPLPIMEIAAKAGIDEQFVEQYGRTKAKIDLSFLESRKSSPDGNLILVTAITPTPAGEGKTTTTIGLADGLRKIGKRSILALREPSMGPVFGVKGGAAGGGYAQVIPMDEINLHFTGDFHAISAANNLLAAMIDNHIFQGNELGINPSTVVWRRCVDMNDRQLRFVVDGLGGAKNGVPREDGYDITVASEVMAILCLSTSVSDLKARLGRIIIGYSYDGNAVTASDLKAAGAMTAILKDALKPNLVQSLEGTPAFIHGGPFANIAHGCNSVLATKMALKCGDYVCTEAGFGADLGAEKFMDIKGRTTGLRPKAVVVVATVRALKMHGGLKKDSLGSEDLDALDKGLPNLLRHVSVMTDVYKIPCVVAVNRFPTDTEAELELVARRCRELGVNAVLSEVWGKGGEGGIALAEEVVRLCSKESSLELTFEDSDPLETKISKVVKRIYRGSSVSYAPGVRTKIRKLEASGFATVPVCMAKTQYSFSDDPKKLCAPTGFTVTVRDVTISAGAGFKVVYTGEIMTMPGLPKIPQATVIDVDESGKITGLM
ncbi:MAG: formate--tetrahydrofolate ligase [Spirochaetales bacterium]|nr:formate--tetrahydrofolate ligase [Spirochaetales bacterium]